MGLRVLTMVVVVVVLLMATQLAHCKTNNLLVILLDGFRWDYVAVHSARTGLPGFHTLMSSGTGAEYLNPVFPTLSFPNWYTISTGLYPESHGIVGNFIYDPERGRHFAVLDPGTTGDLSWWEDREPLWTTTTRAGYDTALFQWARCDITKEKWIKPRSCEPFMYDATGSTSAFAPRLTSAVDLMHDHGYRVVMVYEGAVDTMGHLHGPVSPEVTAAVEAVDEGLQGLWRHLQDKEMTNTTNVVVLSDHGMTGIRDGSATEVEVGACLQPEHVEAVVVEHAYLIAHPRHGKAHQVLEALRSCPGVEDKISVYLKDDVPPRYNYKAHRFIFKVVAIAKKGYLLKLGEREDIKVVTGDFSYMLGNHGFDDTQGQHADMRGILYAAGPDFARGSSAGVVQQVDVYGLFCRALHLACHPHNGTAAHIEAFFTTEHPTRDLHEYLDLTTILPHLVISAAITLLLLLLINMIKKF